MPQAPQSQPSLDTLQPLLVDAIRTALIKQLRPAILQEYASANVTASAFLAAAAALALPEPTSTSRSSTPRQPAASRAVGAVQAVGASPGGVMGAMKHASLADSAPRSGWRAPMKPP